MGEGILVYVEESEVIPNLGFYMLELISIQLVQYWRDRYFALPKQLRCIPLINCGVCLESPPYFLLFDRLRIVVRSDSLGLVVSLNNSNLRHSEKTENQAFSVDFRLIQNLSMSIK